MGAAYSFKIKHNRTKIQEILREETNYKLTDANIDNNISLKITKFYKIHYKTLTKKEKDM